MRLLPCTLLLTLCGLAASSPLAVPSGAIKPHKAGREAEHKVVAEQHKATPPSLTVRGGAAAVATKGGKAVTASKPGALVGWAGVVGGALCHLALGTVYCWGNFSPYCPPKLRFFDGKGAPGAAPDTLWVLPGAFIAQMLTMPIGPWFQAKLGCRGATLFGCWLMAAGVLLSSYAQSLLAFMASYSLLFGAGVGIAYTAPMVNGWRWFPDKKGLVSGSVVAGFGAGGFIFNQVGSRIINPRGLSAVGGVYPPSVYAAFPTMLRRLAAIYFVLTGVGAALIRAPPSASAAGGKGGAVAPAKGLPLREALRSRTFWTLWTMILLSGTAGINVAGVYKSFGSRLHADDKFQSLVGSLGALCNGAGRLFWGNLVDSQGFKKPFTVVAAVQAATMAAYTRVSTSRAGFAAATCAILFCLGGNFAMFPAVTTKLFGVREGALIYGVMFSAFSIASVGGAFITKALVASLGWDGVFKTMSVLSVVLLGVLSTFREVAQYA